MMLVSCSCISPFGLIQLCDDDTGGELPYLIPGVFFHVEVASLIPYFWSFDPNQEEFPHFINDPTLIFHNS